MLLYIPLYEPLIYVCLMTVKVKASIARSFPVENLLALFVRSIINYLQ